MLYAAVNDNPLQAVDVQSSSDLLLAYSGSQPGWFCPLRDAGPCLGLFLVVMIRKEVLYCHPGMLENILQCTGELPTAKNYPPSNINSAKMEKPFKFCALVTSCHMWNCVPDVFKQGIIMQILPTALSLKLHCEDRTQLREILQTTNSAI